MRVSRLHVSQALTPGVSIDLSDDEAHYVRTVLRLKKGQQIVLFNGHGGEFYGRLALVSKKEVVVEVEQYNDRSVESSLSVSLGLSISRGDRMDWAVQKAVELGVARITPLLTERCVIKFRDEEKKRLRLQHWRHIVRHAAEQSGRTVLAEMPGIEALASWAPAQQGLKLFLDPYAEQSLANLQPGSNGCVTLLSGPEGGFTEQEREDAKAAGFKPVRMGPRIMRTETAVLAAVTAVQTLWGDFIR
ncbi:16S rRNA (uracil(1498)-N(3))-methyltransferase [Methylomarinum vadi]|uniref:16S rRNA (uracil(1498)-N(3))-methyltransferase n=1 Tax=Methylomarinum vadi TaxID=438855 RepID=UPI0004DF4B5E|nr:16S rRNA (uracil(1498)-N(3))-methyltransferase [Methylomarinum vadi]